MSGSNDVPTWHREELDDRLADQSEQDDIPWGVCATCRLRLLNANDAESLARHANDRDIWLNLRDRFPHPYARSDADGFIARVAEEKPRTTFGIIVEGVAVGSVGLILGRDIERLSAEIGYWVGREFWGRGIATDAVRAATDYAFRTLDICRVFALPFVRNVPSHRVLEKAGYTREGFMRRSAIKDGQILDQYLYATYDDGWDSSQTIAGASP